MRSVPFLLVLGLTGLASSLSMRPIEPMVPLIARSMEVQVTTVALLASAFNFPYALGQPFLGALGDARGKLKVMFACLVLVVVGLVVSALATDVTMLFAARAVTGIAAGGVIPLGLALVGDRYELAERQVAISRYLVAVIAAQMLGAPVAGALAPFIGWRWVLVLIGAVVAAILIFAWFNLRVQMIAPTTPINARDAVARFRLVFANPKAAICFASVFLEGIAIFGVFPYVAILLEQRALGGVVEAGLVLGAFGFGGLGFTAAVGPLIRRFGSYTVMRLGGVIVAAGLVGSALAPHWLLMALAFFWIGFGFYMLHSALQTQATELAPSARGSGVALHAFFFFLGSGTGPIVFGALLLEYGHIATEIGASLVALGIGFGAAFLLRRADGLPSKP